MTDNERLDVLTEAGRRLDAITLMLKANEHHDHQLDQLLAFTAFRLAELAKASRRSSNVVRLKRD
jgi:hypothetical protein|tara:strand:+ start:10159 stop:10353 length:195 start_codon:yes stop_codon:yes gene_type:complete